MSGYESNLPQIERSDAVVLGISIDPQPSKTAWAKTLGPISFDLLSDFHPHGEVAQKYGVFRPKEGFSERAVFVVGKDGRIKWSRPTTSRSSPTTRNCSPRWTVSKPERSEPAER